MSPALAELRRTLATIEGGARAQAPILSFDIAPLDQRLTGCGLRLDALHEAAAADAGWGGDTAASLFLASIAARSSGPVLWVVRRRDLFAPGLYQAGLAPERLIHAEATDDAELLAIMEEGLRHRGLGAVIGEAKKVSMSATRRLQLAVEGGGTIALLLRRHLKDDADPLATPSAAMTRWRIASAPSTPLAVEGVGRAQWRLELVRQRAGEPFAMTLEAADEAGRLALPAAMADRADRPAIGEGRHTARADESGSQGRQRAA